MAKVGSDQFCNTAILRVTESAANTLTFAKLESATSLFEKVAFLVSRLEWYTAAAQLMGTAADAITFGLTVSNQIAGIEEGYTEVVDTNEIALMGIGALAGFLLYQEPNIIKDFSNLPGKGILVPPNPLYIAAKGTGLGAAATVYCRMFYTVLQLTPDQYWELVETRRVLGTV